MGTVTKEMNLSKLRSPLTQNRIRPRWQGPSQAVGIYILVKGVDLMSRHDRIQRPVGVPVSAQQPVC